MALEEKVRYHQSDEWVQFILRGIWMSASFAIHPVVVKKILQENSRDRLRFVLWGWWMSVQNFCQSILWMLRYFSLDQSGGPTNNKYCYLILSALHCWNWMLLNEYGCQPKDHREHVCRRSTSSTVDKKLISEVQPHCCPSLSTWWSRTCCWNWINASQQAFTNQNCLHQWPSTAGPWGHNTQMCTHRHTRAHFSSAIRINIKTKWHVCEDAAI